MTPLSTYELDDLHGAILERIEEELLPALSKANRTGELSQLIALLGMSDLLGTTGESEFKPTKVIVLGDSMVSEGKLRSKVRKRGLDSREFEFVLGYNELKHYNFDKLRNSFSYRAILVGPMPHSTPGKGGASSFIARVESQPDCYPPFIRLEDSTGLKITNNSFARALDLLLAMG